jgi:hypothetical protein
MITLKDYWMGRDAEYAHELTDEIRANAQVTVERANLLLTAFTIATNDTEQRHVNSGWRPPAVNAVTPGAAPKSKHMTGQAIDIADPEGDLDQYCLDHLLVLQKIGLWLEDPSSTKGWCHVQCVPPKSMKRVFYP